MTEKWPTALDMMETDPHTVDVNDTLSVALGRMHSGGTHELPVIEKGKLVGLFSYDAIGRRHNLPLTTKVRHLMSMATTVPPRALYPEIAERLLDSDSRAVCVVDPRDHRLLGIVSRTALTRYSQGIEGIASRPISGDMIPVTIVFREKDPCGSILSAFSVMKDHPVPVVDSSDRLVGSVSLQEIGESFSRPRAGGHQDRGESRPAAGARIGSIMRSAPPTVSRESTLGDCARLMTRDLTDSVFVMEDSRPIGVISHASILAQAVRQSPTVEGAYIQISGLGNVADSSLLSALDRVLSNGLKRISHVEPPSMLTIHFAPHSSRQLSDATVEARLHTESGRVFHATRTDWNLLGSVTTIMDELLRQVKEGKSLGRDKLRKVSPRRLAPGSIESRGEPDLERRLTEVLSEEPRRRARARGRRA